MLQPILRDFINRIDSIEKTQETEKFIQKILTLSESEIKTMLSLDDKKLVDYITNMGCEKAIIEIFENANDGIKFYENFNDLERKETIDNVAKTNILAKMGVFSTIVDDKITFIVSSKNQVNGIKEHCSDDDYDVFLGWPWEISRKNTFYKLVIEDIAGENKHLVMATGQPQIDQIAQYFNGFEVDCIVEYRRDILNTCLEKRPDILVVSDNIGGTENLLNILIQTKHAYPDLRIIYFTSQLNPRDEVRRQMLSVLVEMGVYDILFDNRFSVDILKHLLKNPKPKEAVSKIVIKEGKRKNSTQKRQLIELIVNEEDTGSASVHSQKNIHSFISSKGGVGKTFIVSNLISVLDRESMNSLAGKPPKIAVIDGDFMGCGLSNIFKSINKDKNILKAIDIANSVIDVNNEGKLTNDKNAIANAVEQIRECFVQLNNYKNVYILGGNEGFITDEQMKKINSHAMTFIIEAVMKDFDIVIADITADFELKIWFPFFSFSRQLFSVMTQDFNSVSNALRHQPIIEEFVGQKSKIKYVLNRHIENEKSLFNSNSIEELTNYKLLSKVPDIPQQLFIDNLYEGKLIVEEDSELAHMVKIAIVMIASQIWPIKDYEKYIREYEKLNTIEEDSKDDRPNTMKDILKQGISIIFPQIEDFEKKDTNGNSQNLISSLMQNLKKKSSTKKMNVTEKSETTNENIDNKIEETTISDEEKNIVVEKTEDIQENN